MPTTPITFLLIVLFSGSALSQQAPIRRAELSASHLQPETFYYNVLITGKKVGWMRQSIKRTKFEGVNAYALEGEFVQKLLNEGKELKTTSFDVEYFSAEKPYQFLGGSTKSAQNGFQSATEIVRSDEPEGGFIAKISSGRAQREKDLGEMDYTLGDVMADAVWCEENPDVGDSIRVRELDFTDLEIRAASNTLVEKFPMDGVGVIERCGLKARYVIDYDDPVGKISGKFICDATGNMLSGDISGAVSIELTTRDDALKLEANLDLFESTLIKIDQSLGDPMEVTELVLEISGASAAVIKNSANQSAEYDAKAEHLLLKIGREHGTKARVTEDARETALEETSAYPTKDAQIIALTERAIGRATRPKAKIKRLVDFVDTFIVDDTSSEPLSVNDIIDTQRGDCTEHSQLFVTMARAAGIPARMVSGFIYGEASTYCFGGHAWCEVEVDGHWHPVDPTWGETMINATHIRISGDRPSAQEMEVYLGGLKLRVLSVTDKNGNRREFAKPSK
ncbi:MAG: hypothetical protein ACI8XO_001771 [Verrucomicrobiales bacterium]|jgi:hypothetical protein